MTETAAPLQRDPTDEALAERVARRDVAAFAVLYDRYARPVYAMAAHLLGVAEVEEVVQETFLRLWHRAEQYDVDRGMFAPWFMTIARHLVRAEIRRRGRDPIAAIADVEAVLARVVDPAPSLDSAVSVAAQAEAIHHALGALPEEQRRVLLLAYFGGLSQRTIAQTLGWPLGTVKKRTSLAMQKLRGTLHGEIETKPSDSVFRRHERDAPESRGDRIAAAVGGSGHDR